MNSTTLATMSRSLRAAAGRANVRRSLFKALLRFAGYFAGIGLGKRYPALNKQFFRLYWMCRPNSVTVAGRRMFLSPGDAGSVSHELITRGEFEPFETELFAAVMSLNGIVLDIGANIGYYTLLAAAEVGSAGRVLAFEPDAENYAVLAQNVRLNGFSNVDCYQLAVSDRHETLQLYLNETNKGDHRTYAVSGRKSVTVSSVALDSFGNLSDTVPSVIKMDIQGAEVRAVFGMRGLIEQARELALFTEYWPFGFRESGTDPTSFLTLLAELGFEVLVIEESNSSLRRVLSAEDIEPSLGPYGEANLLCIKGHWAVLDQYRDSAVTPEGHR